MWQRDLSRGAHLGNEARWHFPGECPTARPTIGRLGRGANPPDPADADPEMREAAALLTAWREEGMSWVTDFGAVPTPKRQRIEQQLSPGSKEAVLMLVRKAQNGMATPVRDR